MSTLAIKGHATCSKEVIEILEMLGGHNNSHNFLGRTEYNYYYIGNHNTISCIPKEKIDSSFVTFTIEEFFEKYPYKVGDKVQHKGATSCGIVYVIERMEWANNIGYEIRPLYDYYHIGLVKVFADELQPHKEKNNGK